MRDRRETEVNEDGPTWTEWITLVSRLFRFPSLMVGSVSFRHPSPSIPDAEQREGSEVKGQWRKTRDRPFHLSSFSLRPLPHLSPPLRRAKPGWKDGERMSKVSRNVVNREPNEAATEGERNLWMVDFIMDFMGFFCYFHNKIHNKSTYKIIKNNKCRNDPKNPKIKKINEKKLGVFGSLYTPSSHHIPFQPFPLRSSGLLTPFQLLPSLWCERECWVTWVRWER